MAVGPENRFIAAVHKKLHKGVHREKTANPYRGGTPDVYYEGNSDLMWTEYKFTKKRRVVDLMDNRYFLSPLQQQWLLRAHDNGVNTSVIVGWEKGGVIYNGSDWTIVMNWDDFVSRSIPKQEIAEWIETVVAMPLKRSEA